MLINQNSMLVFDLSVNAPGWGIQALFIMLTNTEWMQVVASQGD
jgi:hypothetical protein